MIKDMSTMERTLSVITCKSSQTVHNFDVAKYKVKRKEFGKCNSSLKHFLVESKNKLTGMWSSISEMALGMQKE